MPRIRQIKPEFFLDDELASIPRDARLLFIGLWVIADKAGRMEDRPAKIKAQLFPYDTDVSYQKIDALLNDLRDGNFIIRYQINNKKLIQIRSFSKHQHCHVKEPESTIPEPDLHQSTVLAPDLHRASPSASGVLSIVSGDIGSGNKAASPPGARCELGKCTNGSLENCQGAFDQLWGAYPRHEPGRKQAKVAWCKAWAAGMPAVEAILDWIARAKSSKQWQDKSSIPYITTWINQRRWEGDPPPKPNEMLWEDDESGQDSIGTIR